MELSGTPSRRYNFIINGCNDVDVSMIARMPCRYICYVRTPSDSLDIMIGFVMFSNTITRRSAKKKFRLGTFVEVPRTCNNACISTIKDSGGIFVEFGRRPNNSSQYCCSCGAGAFIEDEQDPFDGVVAPSSSSEIDEGDLEDE